MVFMSGGLRIYPKTPLYRIALKEGLIAKGQSLLWPPVYYFSHQAPRSLLDRLLREATLTRPNCILGAESTPPPEMLEEAIEYRKLHGVEEPMFRTLLRIRKQTLFSNRRGNGGLRRGTLFYFNLFIYTMHYLLAINRIKGKNLICMETKKVHQK